MHAFNVGDWVICPEDNAIFLVDGNYNGGYQSTEYWSGLDFILWEPKKGEWCWFWKEGIDVPRLRQFISSSSVFGRPITYTVQPDKSTMMYRNYTGIEVYQYCEPFIVVYFFTV